MNSLQIQARDQAGANSLQDQKAMLKSTVVAGDFFPPVPEMHDDRVGYVCMCRCARVLGGLKCMWRDITSLQGQHRLYASIFGKNMSSEWIVTQPTLNNFTNIQKYFVASLHTPYKDNNGRGESLAIIKRLHMKTSIRWLCSSLSC